jgi:hypothetical protein
MARKLAAWHRRRYSCWASGKVNPAKYFVHVTYGPTRALTVNAASRKRSLILHFDYQLHIHVAFLLRAKYRHALGLQA